MFVTKSKLNTEAEIDYYRTMWFKNSDTKEKLKAMN